MYVILILVLAITILVLVSIAQVYRFIPYYELKRRARSGDKLAKSLYKVATYKFSAQFLLWFLAAVASAGFFIVLSKNSPIWVAFIASFALIWLAYIWIPRSGANVISQYLAQILARPLAWVLQYVHKPLKSVQRHSRRLSRPEHTGLFEKDDIVRLLEAQQQQSDNRIEAFELELLTQVIGFTKTRVRDVIVPKRRVKSVSYDEILGPVVLGELNATGHNYFPVYDGRSSNIVGILNRAILTGSKRTFRADEIMSNSIYYAHEDQYLGEILQVIIHTSQELFVVVNSKEEYTGIITARDVLKKLVGEVVSEQFDNYANKSLVANHFKEPPVIESEDEDVKITEVVE